MKRLILGTLSVITLTSTVAFVAQAGAPFANGRPVTGIQLAANPTQTLASGQFVTVDQDHATTGTARIVVENGQRFLEFDAKFDTANGPDVNVLLHRSATVGVNLQEKDYITLAPLGAFSGARRYAIPATVKLDTFKSVAIWCRKFNVTFGYAELK